MKATGIVRRIDDLGRIVIPKEIRKTLKIREGDPLEIFTDREGMVVLKKYSPVGGFGTAVTQYAQSLAESLGCTVCITDNDTVIAVAGAGKKQMEENEETQEVLARFENTGTSIFTAEFAVLTQLTGFKLMRGMLCALKRRPLEDFRKLCEGKNRIAILEDVMNPTNVGAIFRSAAAMHMDAVLLTSGCSNPLYRRASRVSMGTVFQIPWTFIQDDKERRCDRKEIWPVQAIENLKALGYKTAALALTDDSVSIDDPQLMSEEKLAVIRKSE